MNHYPEDENKKPTMKTLCIFSGYVAGVGFAKPNMGYVRPDEPVDLALEPHNQYDPLAIRVGGPQTLGYIPREACYAIHHALNEGFQPVAQIVEVSTTKYKEILVRVFVEVKE